MSVQDRIDLAYKRLADRPGFISRPDQQQLSLLISDCIEGRSSGAFEAPTGLGKSLAALIPAIAHALEHSRRVVIATYTNILAEQYWQKDLPLALSLFDEEPKTTFLIGRQRYACKSLMEDLPADVLLRLHDTMELGLESEFRSVAGRARKDLKLKWSDIAVPPVCAAGQCPHYNSCYYFGARRRAERAEIVITNHSVVLQDAISNLMETDSGALGKPDCVIFDEAHDLPQAAFGAFEFELSSTSVGAMQGLIVKIESTLLEIAQRQNGIAALSRLGEQARESLNGVLTALAHFEIPSRDGTILTVSPDDLGKHSGLSARIDRDRARAAFAISSLATEAVNDYRKSVKALMDDWVGRSGDETLGGAKELTTSYLQYLDMFAINCQRLFLEEGTAVTYGKPTHEGSLLRRDVVEIASILREALWNRGPAICMSATLALDHSFAFFNETTGFTPTHEEVLPSPFDFPEQAAVYVPRSGRIPDPTIARKMGSEPEYFAAVARELEQIITMMEGRTLALFHSRREMEEVAGRMNLPIDLPILMQRSTGVATVGERFRRETKSSLFALRSFWTGFDAPGETLSCVVVVRIPFEVPMDPPSLTRTAWFQTRDLDSFSQWSLPNAKMMIRQGTGRLIRRAEDRGLIVLLDPRLRSKNYGEDILRNLPAGIREFNDLEDAVVHLGLVPTEA